MVQTLKIEGMSCHHCVMALKKELARVVGLVVHEVEVGSARVEFEESCVPLESIHRAVEDAGYTLVAIS